ncbi:transforming growth factor beta-1 proprotein-like [Ochotona princeps]|uniref:transforming growth factor beta-1 proprotein-like n=1 Tax=Ochotona princeps TaxID=9978 RepID=UPI002714F793|nr:transforming growth factor beta-1 proprotein-like [Ochotona princeps]
MLPSGQQMLPLLWFLLWMPKFGLSSNIGLWDIFANPNDVNIPSRYTRACEGVNRETTEKDAETNGDSFNDDLAMESMVDINNEIYQQFTKSWQSVYMVFNKTNLRKAVPDPSLLCLAELNMKRQRKTHKQLLMLYERQRKNSWNYRSLRFLTHNDTSNWLWFDVTEVVRQWIKQKCKC